MLGFGLLVLVGIVLLVIWAARSSRSGFGGSGDHSDPALDSLKRRFANGEINKEQYDEMRRVLGG
ncbi:MAG: SHOCT domain-containing protein [Coriobacteriia bacterium]